MINYVDKHIIAFVDEWGDTVMPQLNNVRYKDLTKVFIRTKKNKMIQNSIKEGKKTYVLGFKNCRGMIQKWLYDERGRIIKQQGRGLVDINPSVITMSIIDINVPFISSDEILLVRHPKDKPYNLEREIIEEAMTKAGFNPAKDIIFIFLTSPTETDFTIHRFVDEFKHIIKREYCRAKGILAIKDPKWVKYHGSDEVSKYTNTFFFNGIRLSYTNREALKKDRTINYL